MTWLPLNFGASSTGVVITAIPTDGFVGAARNVTVMQVACPVHLPAPHGDPMAAWVVNDSDGQVPVLPGSRDRLGRLEVDAAVVLEPGERGVFWLFDGPMMPAPRAWVFSVIGARV